MGPILTLRQFLLLAMGFAVNFAYGADLNELQQCVPSNNRCDFYTCAESVFNCGPNGYMQKTAKLFCENDRLEQSNKVEAQVKVTLQNIRQCLQQEFLEFSRKLSCKQLQEVALDSHSSCFVESGFCSLSMAQIFQLRSGMSGLSEVTSTWKTLAIGGAIFSGCEQLKKIRLGVHENEPYYTEVVQDLAVSKEAREFRQKRNERRRQIFERSNQ